MLTKTSIRKSVACILSLVLSVLSADKAFSDTINIAIEDYNYPPRYFSSSDGLLQGIEIDLMNKVAKSLSLEAKFVKCPWNRCLLMMKHGLVDVMPYLLKRPDREKYMLYVDPAYQPHSEKCFFVRKGNANRIQKYEDLYTVKVGVQKGAAYFSQFDRDDSIPKIPVMEEKLLFPMLLKDRFDTFVGACQPLNYIALKSGYSEEVEAASYRFSAHNPAHIAISRKSSLANRASELELIIQNLVTSGELSKLSEAYFIVD